MLDLLLESALRSLALGVAVWLGLALLRVRNPRTQMTAWTVVLVASLAMPALLHRLTVTIPAAAPPLRHAAVGISICFSTRRPSPSPRCVFVLPMSKRRIMFPQIARMDADFLVTNGLSSC